MFKPERYGPARDAANAYELKQRYYYAAEERKPHDAAQRGEDAEEEDGAAMLRKRGDMMVRRSAHLSASMARCRCE
jgi:hypothetical protein